MAKDPLAFLTEVGVSKEVAAKSPIDVFMRAVDDQIESVRAGAENTPKVARWYREEGDGSYTTKIGRSPIEYRGFKRFKLPHSDALIEFYGKLKEAAVETPAFAKLITDQVAAKQAAKAGVDVAERPRRGRRRKVAE